MCSGPNLQLLHAPGHGDGRTVLSHVTLPVLLPLPLLLLQKTFGDGQHQTLPEDSRKTSNACAREAAPVPPTVLPLSSTPPSFYSLVCPISVVTERLGEWYGLTGGRFNLLQLLVCLLCVLQHREESLPSGDACDLRSSFSCRV